MYENKNWSFFSRINFTKMAFSNLVFLWNRNLYTYVFYSILKYLGTIYRFQYILIINGNYKYIYLVLILNLEYKYTYFAFDNEALYFV